MLDSIIALGDKIEAEFDSVDRDYNKFPSIASRNLIALKLSSNFYTSFSDWLPSLKELPPQLDAGNHFGEPPITLFNNGIFVIDLYFWNREDTVIHSHSFRGAFKIAQGVSLQTTYTYQNEKELACDLFHGDLKIKEAKLLQLNDVQEIHTGDEFIHFVAHIAKPTVTLCVRTTIDSGQQRRFYSNGFSFSELGTTSSLPNILNSKRLAFLDCQAEFNPELLPQVTEKFLKEINSYGKMLLYVDMLHGRTVKNQELRHTILTLIQQSEKDSAWFPVFSNAVDNNLDNFFEVNTQLLSTAEKLHFYLITKGIAKTECYNIYKRIGEGDFSVENNRAFLLSLIKKNIITRPLLNEKEVSILTSIFSGLTFEEAQKIFLLKNSSASESKVILEAEKKLGVYFFKKAYDRILNNSAIGCALSQINYQQ